MKKVDTAAKEPMPYHHGDLRQALLDAAWNSVREQGFEALSLAALAKEIGVSQAAPYRHFADRNTLLAAVAERGFLAFSSQLQTAASTGRKGTPLSRMAHAYVAFGTQNAGVYRLMFASPVLGDVGEDAELKTAARRSFQVLLDALADITNPRQRKRRALHVWVALHGAVMLANQHLLEGGPVETSLADLVETIVAD